MDTIKEKRRWPLALVVITAVVIASAAMIYSYRDAPGRLPVSAISDGSNGIIAAWQKDEGIYAQRSASAHPAAVSPCNPTAWAALSLPGMT